MTPAEWLLAAAGLLISALVGGWFAWPRSRARARARAGPWQERRIRVRAGYDPAVIHVRAGVPVRLVFHREETVPCSERVVFPDLGISAALPAFRETPVELPAAEPGTHPFTCEMEMLHGRLIVDPDGGLPLAPQPDIPVAA